MNVDDVRERVRAELIRIALTSYEDAGVRGLCAEGAWEAAIAAMRQADLQAIADRSIPLADR